MRPSCVPHCAVSDTPSRASLGGDLLLFVRSYRLRWRVELTGDTRAIGNIMFEFLGRPTIVMDASVSAFGGPSDRTARDWVLQLLLGCATSTAFTDEACVSTW